MYPMETETYPWYHIYILPVSNVLTDAMEIAYGAYIFRFWSKFEQHYHIFEDKNETCTVPELHFHMEINNTPTSRMLIGYHSIDTKRFVVNVCVNIFPITLDNQNGILNRIPTFLWILLDILDKKYPIRQK